MERSSDIRTKRWTRSPRGEFLGVATGLAEWRGFPPSTTRVIVFLCVVFTGFFPGMVAYLGAAIILPMQTPADIVSSYDSYYSNSRRHRKTAEYEDVNYTETSYKEKSTEELRKEYEELKKKVEEMEGQMFDREKDWDSRFNSGDK